VVVMNFFFSLLVVVLAFCLNATAQPPRKLSTQSAQPVADPRFYRSPYFNVRYRIPYGWVDRTLEMQEGHDAAKGEVLLAIFERPPQAAGDTINSAVVIGAEKAAVALKKPEDYLATLIETTSAQGFKITGDPSGIYIDSQRMVRADFSKALNEKLTMHQSTLLILARGQIVTFTFIAESADALDNLIEGLSFGPTTVRAK
jgi:hypothetical protein